MRLMAAVRKVSACGVALLVAATFSIGMKAQVGDPATLIKEKLVSQIKAHQDQRRKRRYCHRRRCCAFAQRRPQDVLHRWQRVFEHLQ